MSFVGETKETSENQAEKKLRKISQDDLDQNTKQGNTWVAIHDKVYDLSAMKEQAPCGEMLIEYYAGMSFPFHSRRSHFVPLDSPLSFYRSITMLA